MPCSEGISSGSEGHISAVTYSVGGADGTDRSDMPTSAVTYSVAGSDGQTSIVTYSLIGCSEVSDTSEAVAYWVEPPSAVSYSDSEGILGNDLNDAVVEEGVWTVM